MQETESRRLERDLAESIAAQAASSPVKIEAKKPDQAAVAIEMLAQGVSIVRIRQATGISLSGLTRMRQDHGGVIAQRQERAARDAARAADAYRVLLMERADQLAQDPEALAKVPPQALAIAYGILTDKGQSLAGQVTSIVEHRVGPTLEAYREAIRKAKARVIEVGRADSSCQRNRG